MDFQPTEEAEAIAELANQVLGDASSHEHLRDLERAGAPRMDIALWATLAKVGLLGAFVPEENGGAGLDLLALGAVLEVAGKTSAAVPLWETLALGVLPIAEFAPQELKDDVLRKVAAGEMTLTAAWHEDGGECLIPTAVATRTDDGFSITGSKICVPYGLTSDASIIPAAIEGGSVGLFLVKREDSGVAVEPLQTTFGDPQAAWLLADAPAALVAEGHQSLSWAYQRAVATQCAQAVGVCEEAIRLTAEYTKERKQFDVPIASFQAVAHRAADAFMDTAAIKLTADQALWRLTQQAEAPPEVATAKFWAAEGGQRVVHAAVHLHGGVGVDRDYPLHRCFLAAKQIELQLGGTTRQLLDLGRFLASQSE